MTYWVKTDESYKYGIIKWLYSLIHCNAKHAMQQFIIITITTHSFTAATTYTHLATSSGLSPSPTSE